MARMPMDRGVQTLGTCFAQIAGLPQAIQQQMKVNEPGVAAPPGQGRSGPWFVIC
jgi:hypothetical protein